MRLRATLMDRMGHDSERAAMIYLHGSAKRRQAIADTLSQLASEELKRGSKRNARPPGSRSGNGSAERLPDGGGQAGGTGADLQGKLGAPSATRTRDLLLRRHNRPSAVQTSNDARHHRAKQPQAVAVRTILRWPGSAAAFPSTAAAGHLHQIEHRLPVRAV